MKADFLKYLPLFLMHRLEKSHGLRLIVSNTGWMIADKIVRMGVGLYVGIWIARYLGPEKFGSLSYAQAFVALFSSLSALGLDGIVVRNIVRNPGERDEIMGSAFLLRLMAGATAIVIVIGAIIFSRPDDPATCQLVAVISLGMIFQAFDTIDYLFQSQILSKYSIWPKNAAFLFASAIKLYFVVKGAPLIAFAWVGVVESVVGSCGLLITYRFSGNLLSSWSSSRLRMKSLLADSWPLIFSGIVIMIYMRIDQIMLGNMSGKKEVGIYAVAVGLAEAWYFVPGTIVTSVFPHIVKASAENNEIFNGRLQQLYNLMALLGFLVALPATFLAGWVVETLYGTAYAKAGPMLAVLVWAGIFVNLGIARSTFLTAMNWTRLHFITVAMGCFVNVVLNCLLIPRYGGMGAVIASCVAYWFAAHGVCFLYRPLFRTGIMMTKALLYPKVW